MPQITNIGDASKSYTTSTTLNNNRGQGQGSEQFSVAGAPRQEQIQAANDKNAGNNAQTTMGQKDLIPLAITTTKNQTLAVETVKDIINTDLLNTARLNGYTELVGELEQLSSTLYIPAKDLLKEILNQEKQNTMFSGDKFYELLREVAQGADDTTKEAIGNMLKAINFSQNKNEITTAISSNLKFLAEYFSPNKNLSAQLTELADRWGSDEASTNFANLRGKTAELMQNLSDSLLNDSHTQTLLPIVTHNISKYNTNNSMLREYFGQLLSLIPSYEMRNELIQSFESLLANLTKGNAFTNYTISDQKNQVDFANFSGEYQIDEEISAYLTENLSDTNYIDGLLEQTGGFSNYISELREGSSPVTDVIKQLFGTIIADEQVAQTVSSQIDMMNSPEMLVDYLNKLLEAMPEGDLQTSVFEVLEEAVIRMNDEGGQAETAAAEKQASPKGSIYALTEFVEKNINHPALKSIDSFNASNLLQSMINAPGVMTPLAHYILPIQIENTRAFGELWVDNDDESGVTGASGSSHHHLFLTFDVDTIGRFEVDVYANDNTANVSLLHPATFATSIDSVVAKINRIAASTRYTISDFKTGVLKEPHNLSQIFPKLNERRAGLNVKA